MISGPADYDANCPINIIYDKISMRGFFYFESENKIFSLDMEHPPSEDIRKDSYDRFLDMFRPGKDLTTHQKIMQYVTW